ncbi:hypothetical protein MMC11_008224 [Xylographa trunciseda]|nr:hypothetical protein [Xylographa trunciseda]
MQYNSDSLGGRRAPGVDPNAPSFVSSVSSARSVSSPSVDRMVASGSLNTQAYVSSTIRRAVTPGPPIRDNTLTRGRSTLIPDSLPPRTPLRAPKYSGNNAKISPFSAAPMSILMKTPSSAHDQPKSVKHLTCFYWHKYGKCNKADEACLYAHFNTGQYAEEPMHMAPGLPAVAGRNARSQLAFHQNWRSSSPSAFETPQRLGPVASPYTALSEPARDAFQSGLQSNIAKRFMGMSITQPRTVSYEQHLTNAKALRDLIDLQTHMAQVGQERLRSLSHRIATCRESLYGSAAAMGERNIQPHKDLVATLVNQFVVMERDASMMADRLQLMKLEVNRELEKLG